ncbi:MAG: hypothetical protein AAGA56_10025, partial [Myxococcota bacterium]
RVPFDIEAVGVIVQYGSLVVSCQRVPVTDGTARLPSTLGQVPQDGRDDEVLQPVTVSVIGFRQDPGEQFDVTCLFDAPDAADPGVLAIRRRRMPYTTDRILYMPLPIKESCADVACEANETCIGGACEPIDLPAEQIVEYRDDLIFGNSTTCFSPARCLADGVAQPAVLTDPETCTFRHPRAFEGDPPMEVALPPIAEGNLNVEITYGSLGTEILDLDDKEGIVFPDPEDPYTFRLAENLCEAHYKPNAENGGRNIVAVRVGLGCPTKNLFQPICDDELLAIQSREPEMPLTSSDAACPVGQPLESTASSLLVLMDQSSSMSEFFGPDGLAFAVQTPLRNPVAENTEIAFEFIPAASCDATVTPEINFGEVESVREPIGQAVGTTDNLLPNDPEITLDRALTEAYRLLEAYRTEGEQARVFNRQAVVVVGNRNLQGAACTAGTSPAELAAAALNPTDGAEPIFTYVAVLDAPATAENFGDDPVASATALAAAGGTSVFNGVSDEAEGARAVQGIINDLGSCVYNFPESTTQTAFALNNDEAELVYVNPITGARFLIPRVDGCENGDSTVNGWGRVTLAQGTEGIRVCGQPCEDLRTVLDDTATFFAVQGQPAPAIPIRVTVPCSEQVQTLAEAVAATTPAE